MTDTTPPPDPATCRRLALVAREDDGITHTEQLARTRRNLPEVARQLEAAAVMAERWPDLKREIEHLEAECEALDRGRAHPREIASALSGQLREAKSEAVRLRTERDAARTEADQLRARIERFESLTLADVDAENEQLRCAQFQEAATTLALSASNLAKDDEIARLRFELEAARAEIDRLTRWKVELQAEVETEARNWSREIAAGDVLRKERDEARREFTRLRSDLDTAAPVRSCSTCNKPGCRPQEHAGWDPGKDLP